LAGIIESFKENSKGRGSADKPRSAHGRFLPRKRQAEVQPSSSVPKASAIIADMASVPTVDLGKLALGGGGVKIGNKWRGGLVTITDDDGTVRRIVRVQTWLED
jgi:hypothetical protein